jgi:hypothetical protein
VPLGVAPESPAAHDESQPAAQDASQPELETPPPQEMVGLEFTTPMEDGDRLDAFHGDTPVHYRRVDNILGEAGPVPGRAERVMAHAQRERPRRVQEELQLVAGDMEPATFTEAEADQAWRLAMEEIDSIRENRTWELTELPPGHRAIGLKWVYKIKKDEAGVVIKYKARLVTKGYIQQARVDFEEVFAPVARMESIGLSLHSLQMRVGSSTTWT